MKSLPQSVTARLRKVIEEQGECVDFSQEDGTENYHPADDPRFLEACLADAFSEDVLNEYRTHLTLCPHCRAMMANYAKSGVLSISNANVSMPRPVSRRSRWVFYSSGAFSAALILLLCWGFTLKFVGLSGKPLPPISPETSSMLALRQVLLPEDSPNDISILELGCLPNGLRLGKSFPEWDEEHFPQVERAFETVLKEEPENVDIRLDFASFLIFREQDLTRAEQILSELDTDSTRFHRLAGIVAFLRGDSLVAADHFKVVWERQDQDYSFGDAINLAAALLSSGEVEQAKELYQKALSGTDDPRQIKMIEKTLENIQ